MSYSSNSNTAMGRMNRERTPRDGAKSEPKIDPKNEADDNDDGPIDLSMPRYPNKRKDTRCGSSYFASGRRKPPSSYDVDANEQPIDYSKKYVESNSSSAIKTNYVQRNSLNKVKIDRRDREKGFSRRDEKAYPYGDYAETDLDQPTDYSLRYAEDDTDDEEKPNNAYFNGNEQEDKVKTYCTEGTPYESTPFNVSSATSMSDLLRLEDGKDSEISRKTARKINQDSSGAENTTTKEPEVACKEADKDDKEKENEILTKESKNISNELVLNSAGYYEAGTSGRISRVSSLSSPGCANETRNVDVEKISAQVQSIPALPVSPIISPNESREEIEDSESSLVVVADTRNDGDTANGGPEEEKGDTRVVDKEGKVVTFGGEDHYAEQTPLMFSRSSSLGSLTGFEQHSIHDDRSSIVSDFSRRTSGVVSPSELPDSPTQTVPPSPCHNQKNNTNHFSNRAPPLRQLSCSKSPRSKSSVFEDNVTAFKEESTPIEFSAATSLSSLTIDDEPKIIMDTKEKDYPGKSRTSERFFVNTSAGMKNSEIDEIENEKEEIRDRANEERGERKRASEADEDENEDIVSARMSVRMSDSPYGQSKKISDNIVERARSVDSTTNLVRYETSSTLDRLVADVAAVSLSSNTKTKNPINAAAAAAVSADTVRVYCTEDTPANISPVGSQSNLSVLSMLSISGNIDEDAKNRLSEEDEDDKILDDCIRAGIARTLRGDNSFPGTAAVTELNSPSHVSLRTKCHDDEDESNSSPASAGVTKHHSPTHESSTKKPEVYLPRIVENGQDFAISSSSTAKSNDRASSPASNSTAVDHDTSGDDDKILDDCIRVGIARTLQGAVSFPVAAAVTKDNSVRASATEKFEAYLPTTADTQAFSISSTSPAKSNEASTCRKSSSRSNSTVVDQDTLGDDDKLLDDCIRAGIARTLQGAASFTSNAAVKKFVSPRHASSTRRCDDDDKTSDDCTRSEIARTLQGSNSFPGTASATKNNSPRHESSAMKLEAYLPRSVDTRQAYPMSSSSSAKINEAKARRESSSRSNSTAVDRDTLGDDDTLLDDCIKIGIARTLQGAASFASTTDVKKFTSPRHAALTKRSQDGDKTLDDCTRSGIARNLQGSNSFPGTAAATKNNSPRHESSTKKLEAYLPTTVDTRQAYPVSSSSSAKINEATARRAPSSRTNSAAVDHDTSGDDDKLLDDCIRAGIVRTLQGAASFTSTAAVKKFSSPRHASSTKRCYDDDNTVDDYMRSGIARSLQGSNSFPGTAAATKNNSPRHTSSTKKFDEYLPKSADNRQDFSLSSSSSAKYNDAPARRASSARSNFTAVDHDTSGDDDKILDDCIKVGIAKTLQGRISFPSNAAVKTNYSPRHATSTKKIKVNLPRAPDNRQGSSMSKPSPVKRGFASSAIDNDTSGDDDKILDDCIKAGMARTLQGANSFPSTAASTKFNSPRHASSTKKFPDDDRIMDDSMRSEIARTLHGSNSFPSSAASTKTHSPRHVPSTKKFETYSSRPVDTRQAFFSMSSSSSARSNEAFARAPSSRPNSTAVDHDTSGDDDRLLDDCIKAGIARTLQGAVSFTSTTAKNNSQRHASSTKTAEVYSPRHVDSRQAFPMSSLSPAKSNNVPARRAVSTRLNSNDHDMSGDDDRILDDCLRAGIARTLQGALSFQNTAALTACRNFLPFGKPQVSRKIAKQSATSYSPNETSSCSSTRVTTEVYRTSVTRILVPATNRPEESFGDNSSRSENEED